MTLYAHFLFNSWYILFMQNDMVQYIT